MMIIRKTEILSDDDSVVVGGDAVSGGVGVW